MTLKTAGEITPRDISVSTATQDGATGSRFYPMPGVPKRLTPARAHVSDVSYDLYNAGDEVVIRQGKVTTIRCGYGARLAHGEVALVCPRLHLSTQGVIIPNAPGVIDSGHIGDIVVVLTAVGDPVVVRHGEAVAQLLFLKQSNVMKLTDRG